MEYFAPPLLFGGSGGPTGSANGLRDTGGGREAGIAETGMVMRVRGKAKIWLVRVAKQYLYGPDAKCVWLLQES